MKLSAGAGDLLWQLAAMPFLDRLDLVAISGWSQGTVYAAVRGLEDAGLVSPVPHATGLLAPTRRFHVTAAGLRELSRQEGLPTQGLLRSLPVSAQWRRLLLRRLDAVAALYRLGAAVSGVTWPVRFHWYRAMPADAGLVLPGGRTIAVVRQGPMSDRTAFAGRLRRLQAGPWPSGILLLVPDEVRLRHAARLLRNPPAPAFLALEREAVRAGPDDCVWRTPGADARLSLRAALDRLSGRGSLPLERPLARVRPPWDLELPLPGRDLPDDLLPALLRPAEKRVIDLLSDWPWIEPAHLQELLGVSRNRLSRILATLGDFGLATRVRAVDGRLALTDRGLAVLARRDRTSVGASRRRWSATPLDAGGEGDWRAVRGRNARQLLRHLDHTSSVHAFLAALARQARGEGWDVVQLDPPHRASRFFRHGDVLRSVHPDAFGLLRRETTGGPSSSSGSGGRCAPRRWRRGSPHTSATTPPPGPRTTTAFGPTCSSSSATTSRRRTSCASQKLRWSGPAWKCPYGYRTRLFCARRDLWGGPGFVTEVKSQRSSSEPAEHTDEIDPSPGDVVRN